MTAFADALIGWQRRAGRHDLPWQRTRDPYRIWVSEVMLQQTQVATVLRYYPRFIERFPDAVALARADVDEVLGAWSGLGYYSRARSMHACAKRLMAEHDGAFPREPEAIRALPGIGRSTAAAIAAFAWGTRAAILDGNVKRVLARVFGEPGRPGEAAVERRLWALAESLLPEPGEGRIETYTQALMDLGATVCLRTRPRCAGCPVADACVARREDRIESLPAVRPRAAAPLRAAVWALVRAGDAVLLERRPARGVWGGLWSLPEVRPPQDAPVPEGDAGEAVRFIEQRCSLVVRPDGPCGEVRHAFTHFRLRAAVWPLRADAALARAAAPPGHLWLAPGDVAGAPLPRPVRVLLAQPAAGRSDP